jgi:hypothetical protein
MKPRFLQVVALALLLTTGGRSGSAQTSSELKTFLSQRVGLSQDQIAAIQRGQPVVKNMPPRNSAELFLFGVVHINAVPETYIKFVNDFNRLR